MEHSTFEGFESIEEYYQVMETAFKSSLVGFCVYDKDGNFICHNKMHENLSGYTKEMLQVFTAHSLENMERQGASSTVLVLQTGKEVLFEQNMIPTNKQFITKGTPWFDENGVLKYVISGIVDLKMLIEVREEIQKHSPVMHENLQSIISGKPERNAQRLVYSSRAIKNIVDKVVQIKDSDATVLLLGESGTGKELIAKFIHDQSMRKGCRLVKINCGAIPDSLMESEMFGYEPGSFTGGNAKGKIGLLEYADHGTVLLDEVGEMPLSLQTKLLRVLQEREIQRIGRNEPTPVDIRFIASTNVNLEEMVAAGTFRKDLYYRLNVVPITIPPLRERREDISVLISYFMDKYNKKYKVDKTISSEAVERMMKMPFYGNIRELENCIERLILFVQNNEISVEDMGLLGAEPTEETFEELFEVGSGGLKEAVAAYEKCLLEKYIKKYGSARKLESILHMDHSSISKKIKKYGIEEEK